MAVMGDGVSMSKTTGWEQMLEERAKYAAYRSGKVSMNDIVKWLKREDEETRASQFADSTCKHEYINVGFTS